MLLMPHSPCPLSELFSPLLVSGTPCFLAFPPTSVVVPFYSPSCVSFFPPLAMVASWEGESQTGTEYVFRGVIEIYGSTQT